MILTPQEVAEALDLVNEVTGQARYRQRIERLTDELNTILKCKVEAAISKTDKHSCVTCGSMLVDGDPIVKFAPVTVAVTNPPF